MNIAAAILLAALLFSAAAPADAAAPPHRVVVVLAPYLSWNDLDAELAPRLTLLTEHSTLADVALGSAMSAGGSAAEAGAAAISAGGSFRYALGAFGAADATEQVAGVPAPDLYRQLFSQGPGDAGVLYLGGPQQMRAQSAAPGEVSVLGALGSAVRARGARTVAIGCSDLGTTAASLRSRPAGIFAADEEGRVDGGDVSAATLVSDPAAPFGVRSSPRAILAAYDAASSSARPALVVVDPGDLYRAAAFAERGTATASASAHAAAVRGLDAVVGGLVDRMAPDDVMLVVGQAAAAGGETGVLIAGAGGLGLGTSGSTHRAGLVTLGDVADSISGLLGASSSGAIAGTPLFRASVAGVVTAPQVRSYLSHLDATSAAVGGVRNVAVTLVVPLATLVFGAAIVFVTRVSRIPRWVSTLVTASLLAIPCVLAGSVLEFAFVRWPGSGWEVGALMLGTAAVLGAAAVLVGVRGPKEAPLLAVAGLTATTLLVDQWAGAPLSFAQVFGYSPALGGRYYGLGNEMAGLLMGSVLVLVAAVIDTWPDARWAPSARAWGWPAVGAVTMLTAAAPFWGANFGTVVWMTIGFFAGWSVLRGRRIWTWRNALAVAVILAVVAGGLAAIDLAGASRAETHVARAIAGAGTGGVASLAAIVARKAAASMSVLAGSVWGWLMAAALVALAWARWRPPGRFAKLLATYPAYSAALASALFASFASLLTEDSGIVIPAYMLLPIGAAALVIVLRDERLHRAARGAGNGSGAA